MFEYFKSYFNQCTCYFFCLFKTFSHLLMMSLFSLYKRIFVPLQMTNFLFSYEYFRFFLWNFYSYSRIICRHRQCWYPFYFFCLLGLYRWNIPNLSLVKIISAICENQKAEFFQFVFYWIVVIGNSCQIIYSKTSW